MRTKRLGRTELRVPIVGLGTAFIGVPTPEAAATEYQRPSVMQHELGLKTVLAALEFGCTYIDTAAIYGRTQSEKIIGEALRLRPDLAKNCLVTTKVGKKLTLDGFEYDGDSVVRGVEQSLERLGLERLEIVHVHDAMGANEHDIFGRGNIMQTLRSLQRQGLVRFIGTASNDAETNAALIETGEFDVAVVCEAWSLLNQHAVQRIIPAAEEHDVGLVVAAPLERGLLATGPIPGMIYDDRRFSRECLNHVVRLKKICDFHRVPLAAVALQWCTRHPRFASTIPGARTPEEATNNLYAGEIQIPDELWSDIIMLLRHFEKGIDR